MTPCVHSDAARRQRAGMMGVAFLHPLHVPPATAEREVCAILRSRGCQKAKAPHPARSARVGRDVSLPAVSRQPLPRPLRLQHSRVDVVVPQSPRVSVELLAAAARVPSARTAPATVARDGGRHGDLELCVNAGGHAPVVSVESELREQWAETRKSRRRCRPGDTRSPRGWPIRDAHGAIGSTREHRDATPKAASLWGTGRIVKRRNNGDSGLGTGDKPAMIAAAWTHAST